MMSETFDANNQFDHFNKDLRLSLDFSGSASTTNNATASSPTDKNLLPYSDRRGSCGMPVSSIGGGGSMCGSSLPQFANAQSKLDSLKNWSVSTYKCTRQAISEKLGKCSRTVDTEMEQNIAILRDLQRRYDQLLVLARSLASHFHQVQAAQMQLSEYLTDLAQQEADLRDEYTANAETQKIVSQNANSLLAAMNFFISSLNTLCHRTIEDTMMTVRNYETARLEFDAYRIDVEALQQTTSVRGGADHVRAAEAEKSCQQQKERFDKLREDVQVKMRFLHENRIKVMQKQLLLLHNATAAYFSGNQKSLEDSLQKFNIKASAMNKPASWLEN